MEQNTSKTILPDVIEIIEQIANNKIEQIVSKTVDVRKKIEQNESKKIRTGTAKDLLTYINNPPSAYSESR